MTHSFPYTQNDGWTRQNDGLYTKTIEDVACSIRRNKSAGGYTCRVGRDSVPVGCRNLAAAKAWCEARARGEMPEQPESPDATNVKFHIEGYIRVGPDASSMADAYATLEVVLEMLRDVGSAHGELDPIPKTRL